MKLVADPDSRSVVELSLQSFGIKKPEDVSFVLQEMALSF